MQKITYKKDDTLDGECKVSCLKCSGKTSHKVYASYDLRGSHDDGQYSFQWAIDHQIVQCLGCNSISFRRVSSNSEDWVQTDYDGGSEYLVTEDIYPSRADGVKGLADDAIYLPTNVGRIYDETIRALAIQAMWVRRVP